MKKLEKCVNGCAAPVQAPSKVLCKKCLEKLDLSFRRLVNRRIDNTASGTGIDETSPYSED